MSLPANPSPTHTNENKVRIIALLVLLSVVAFLLTLNPLIPVLLVVDFGLRSFDLGRFSPFGQISDTLINTFKLGIKPVFYPPKRFAARIGLAFSIAIVVLQLLDISTLFVAGTLGFFAALESLAGICAGCYVYNWLLPLWQKISPEGKG